MIIDAGSAPVSGQNGVHTRHLSVAGGITQFGAYVETLQPGAWSAQRHWHAAEDEFLYVLEGVATVIDGDGAHDLHPGDAACWRHGDPNAHHVTNRGTAPCRYVIAGSRVAGDVCRYPDSGEVLVNTATQWSVSNASGTVLRSGDLPAELLNLPPVWGSPYDPAAPARRVLRAGSVVAVTGSNYPEGFNDLGTYEAFPISDEGGLTQFGAFTETLMPGARSSQRHWHAAEDEFLLVLDGIVTLIEDNGPQDLYPGMAAGWPAGVPNAHALWNRGDSPVTYLIIGTRLAEDACHYPDIDLHYTRRDGMRWMSRKDGTPYPGWPKETTR